MATSTVPVGLFFAAADHADVVVVEAEVFAETLAPLGEERFAVDQDEGWLSVVGDDGAGGDGLCRIRVARRSRRGRGRLTASTAACWWVEEWLARCSSMSSWLGR